MVEKQRNKMNNSTSMTENDYQLLKRAARAAGYKHRFCIDGLLIGEAASLWNPLTVDKDAFRLAARLKLSTTHSLHSVCVSDDGNIEEAAAVLNEDSRTAALRRAIVIVAAEMGRTKRDKQPNVAINLPP